MRKLTIEEKLSIALKKNPITRDRLFLKILKPSIEKCVGILLKNNKRRTRLHDVDDLIQEANLTVLKVIQKQDLKKIKFALRTYLLGAVKRRIWGMLRKEYALKRRAQYNAYQLELLETKYWIPKNVRPLQNNDHLLLEKYNIKDIIHKINNKLSYPAKEVFKDLISGYTIIEIAVKHSMPLQSVYTILRRKIKPIAKRLLEIE